MRRNLLDPSFPTCLLASRLRTGLRIALLARAADGSPEPSDFRQRSGFCRTKSRQCASRQLAAVHRQGNRNQQLDRHLVRQQRCGRQFCKRNYHRCW